MSGKGEEPAWTLLLIAVLIGVLCWVVWMKFDVQLMQLMRYIRVAELALISPIDPQAKACLGWLWSAPVRGELPSDAVIAHAAACYGTDFLRGLDPKTRLDYMTISPDSLGAMMRLVSYYINWIIVVGCAGVGIHVGFFTKRNKFKVRHTLESFIKTQSIMWPVISPIVNFSPAKSSARVPGSAVPDQLPVFAEALSPEEFLSWHRIPVVNSIPDRERLRRAFLLQLGPRWQGADVMPVHMQALFAAFALQGVQKREECEAFLGKLALAWSPEKGFQPSSELVAEIKKLVRDPQVGGKAGEIAAQYAYRTTALLGVLKWARFMGGVLAPGQFLWLRGEDRPLWYALNNLGRRSFHAEGAGAIAHFMAEDAVKKPLSMPRIDTAIITMNQYMANNPETVIPKREEPKKMLNGKKA